MYRYFKRKYFICLSSHLPEAPAFYVAWNLNDFEEKISFFNLFACFICQYLRYVRLWVAQCCSPQMSRQMRDDDDDAVVWLGYTTAIQSCVILRDGSLPEKIIKNFENTWVQQKQLKYYNIKHNERLGWVNDIISYRCRYTIRLYYEWEIACRSSSTLLW